MAQIDHIADGIYRISSFAPTDDMSFNQFLIALEKLNLRWVHPMHGGSLPHEVWPHYVNGLRSEPFAFEGKLLGRMLPS